MTNNENDVRKVITLGICYCCGHLYGIHIHDSFISYCCFYLHRTQTFALNTLCFALGISAFDKTDFLRMAISKLIDITASSSMSSKFLFATAVCALKK